MKLVIIVLCLFIEHEAYVPSSFRSFDWFNSWKGMLENRLLAYHPLLLLIAALLPILIGVGLFFTLFGHWFWGSISFIFQALIFFYCLGPKNIFKYAELEEERVTPQDYFILVNRACFGVIFWYLTLGIGAVVAYRLIDRLTVQDRPNETAQLIMKYLDWIPARLTATLYLLVGNFQHALPYMLEHGLKSPEKNDLLLAECGMFAAKQDGLEQVTLSQAEQLVWYTLLLLIVFIALFTLVAWL